jgi:hypothetical protein
MSKMEKLGYIPRADLQNSIETTALECLPVPPNIKVMHLLSLARIFQKFKDGGKKSF